MNRSEIPAAPLPLARVAALTLLFACAGDPPPPTAPAAAPDRPAPPDGAAFESQSQALLSGSLVGRRAFAQALPHSNGRSCATCHVPSEDTALRPASVEARLAADPQDPLFNRIDADDPSAEEPGFEHLKKGLVRVVLPLPDNMDVIDAAGVVITPADRTIFVWRGVPTIANTAATGPYQLDGRAATLQDQAQAAILGHSQGRPVSRHLLDEIARFEAGSFTSWRARFVGELAALGVPVAQIPRPEPFMSLSPEEKRGRQLYDRACEACHGGATTDRIVNRQVHDAFFPVLKPDGNVRFEMVPGKGPVPVRLSRPNVEFLNVGYGLASYAAQLGFGTTFTSPLELPHYRFRFYQDGTRREATVDLPPVPVTKSGDPRDLRPALDAEGFPIVGPNLVPQLFTTDPGRAAVTGDPADFEAFDVPQMRGIANTAPYFHDNSSATLRDVLDNYSRFVLPTLPMLELPAVHPPERPGGSKESLSPADKDDLLAYLRRL
jgi:cytochrome c peroxidase